MLGAEPLTNQRVPIFFGSDFDDHFFVNVSDDFEQKKVVEKSFDNFFFFFRETFHFLRIFWDEFFSSCEQYRSKTQSFGDL